MFISLIAAVAQAGGILIDKITFRRWQVEVKTFTTWLFFFLAVFTGSILVYTKGAVIIAPSLPTWERWLPWFLGMLVVAVGWNILYYRSFKHESLQNFELILMLSPLATVILAALVFPEERQAGHFIAAVVAGLVLVWSKIRRDHLQFSGWTWLTILAMVLMSAEAIFIKKSLVFFSPAGLYFIRTAVMFLFFLALWRPNLDISWPKISAIAASAVCGVISMVLKFTAFETIGVVYTTLILVLAPVFVLGGEAIVLRDHLTRRNIIAAVIIIAIIALATLIS